MNWFHDLRLRSKLLLGFGVVLGIALAQSVLTYWVVRRNEERSRWIEHTYEVMGLANDALIALTEMEAAFRGYLLTGRDEFLDRYDDGKRAHREKLEELKEKTADNPAQVKRWDDILARAGAWQEAVTEPRIRARRGMAAGTDSAAASVDFAGSGEGSRHFDGIRAVFAEAIEAERSLLAERYAEGEAETRLLLRVVVWGGLVVLVLGWATAILLSGQVTSRLRQVVEGVEALRTRCIAKLGRAVEAMGRGDLAVAAEIEAPVLEVSAKDEVGALAESVNGIIRQTQATVSSFEKTRAIVGALIDETRGLVLAAQAGRLEVRGDVKKFEGGYRELVEGINATLDAVVEPIGEALRVLERVAERDLTVRMEGEYRGDFSKLKESLNTAVRNLEEALGEASASAEQVASAGQQISRSSQVLARGAGEQASSLEEVSASLQELASMARQNAGNAKEARSLSEGARESSRRGVESMERLSAAVERIKGSADATAKIIKTIDEIAFQTNLLALNAAVEAARAGEAGKGFAVVAEEVRSLAMRSAEAAKNTAVLIEESVRNAESGVELNREVLARLEEIAQQVDRVGEVMAEIAAASEQQSEGVEQISRAVEQMNVLTQQTAASSEESASAAEELSVQAERMRNLIAEFRLSITRPSTATQPAVAAPAGSGRKRVEARAPVGVGAREASATFASVERIQPSRLIPFDEDEAVLGEF